MAIKTAQVKCEVAGNKIMFVHQKRNSDGEWETITQKAYDAAQLSESLQGHLTGYGLRALLQDRASDFRKHGELEYLKAIDEYFDLFMTGELRKTTVRASAIDKALVHLIAELKGESLAWAEAQLKAAPKSLKDALLETYADRLTEIRGELSIATGSSEALTDLL